MLFSTLFSTLQGSAVVTPARPRASPGRNAAKDGDWRQLHHLLHDGGWQAEVDRDRRGASALHLAAGHGHEPALESIIVKLLIPTMA